MREIVGYISMFVFVVIFILMTIFRFDHSEMTETQLLKSFISYHMIVICFFLSIIGIIYGLKIFKRWY